MSPAGFAFACAVAGACQPNRPAAVFCCASRSYRRRPRLPQVGGHQQVVAAQKGPAKRRVPQPDFDYRKSSRQTGPLRHVLNLGSRGGYERGLAIRSKPL